MRHRMPQPPISYPLIQQLVITPITALGLANTATPNPSSFADFNVTS